MGYPTDISEVPEHRLRDELARRADRRARGLCDYCARTPDTTPCQFPDRHRQRDPILSMYGRHELTIPEGPIDLAETDEFAAERARWERVGTKVYEIRRTPFGVTARVLNSGADPYPLPHLERHSPTGFEYGYEGSGPADLARSLLGDALDTTEPTPAAYQAVKRKLIAGLDGNGPHRITEAAVRMAAGL